jgi:hypothetical protein
VSIAALLKNQALDGITISTVSVHSDYPGTTGANEISGATRATVNVGASVGGVRTLAASATVTVPASTIRWIGWRNSSGFLGSTPNGGATPKNFVAQPSTDLIYCPSHGYADTTKVVFWLGTAPAPLVSGTIYYVRDATADTFKVAATSGGTAIDLTAASSFGCVVSTITEKTYAGSATHTVSSGTFLIPD